MISQKLQSFRKEIRDRDRRRRTQNLREEVMFQQDAYSPTIIHLHFLIMKAGLPASPEPDAIRNLICFMGSDLSDLGEKMRLIHEITSFDLINLVNCCSPEHDDGLLSCLLNLLDPRIYEKRQFDHYCWKVRSRLIMQIRGPIKDQILVKIYQRLSFNRSFDAGDSKPHIQLYRLIALFVILSEHSNLKSSSELMQNAERLLLQRTIFRMFQMNFDSYHQQLLCDFTAVLILIVQESPQTETLQHLQQLSKQFTPSVIPVLQKCLRDISFTPSQFRREGQTRLKNIYQLSKWCSFQSLWSINFIDQSFNCYQQAEQLICSNKNVGFAGLSNEGYWLESELLLVNAIVFKSSWIRYHHIRLHILRHIEQACKYLEMGKGHTFCEALIKVLFNVLINEEEHGIYHEVIETVYKDLNQTIFLAACLQKSLYSRNVQSLVSVLLNTKNPSHKRELYGLAKNFIDETSNQGYRRKLSYLKRIFEKRSSEALVGDLSISSDNEVEVDGSEGYVTEYDYVL